MSRSVTKLTRHFADGLSFDDELELDQKSRLMEGRAPSPLTKVTWLFDERMHELHIGTRDGRSSISISKLPDATGFICFETDWNPDNCLLLDGYGKERMRLTVPWQLTKPQNPESAKPPTSFANVSAPYVNPVDGKKGEFGVTAWVEHAGMYYFELDYHTGQFLWGREIRD